MPPKEPGTPSASSSAAPSPVKAEPKSESKLDKGKAATTTTTNTASTSSTTATAAAPATPAAAASAAPPPAATAAVEGATAADEQLVSALRERGTENGWMREFEGDHQALFGTLLRLLRNLVDASGKKPAESFETLPDKTQDPEFYHKCDAPISFSEIEANIRANLYFTTQSFESDLFRLFAQYRLAIPPFTPRYGQLNTLQRFYTSLTSPPNLSLGKEFHFASVKAGPGNASAEELAEGQPGAEGVGVATSRILARHRQFLENGYVRGTEYNIGDWVHLQNPDDPSKPIPAQLFKVFIPEGKIRHPHVTVCRYYRPEQTVHASWRRFYENEVFKSGNYVDLPIEDVLEKTFVMFATKFARGRPKRQLWDPRTPLYVVEHRYSPKIKAEGGGFSKIKSWNACIPEEVRKQEYEMDLFPEPVRAPTVPSPFLRGITGPGKIDETAAPPPPEPEPTPPAAPLPAAAAAAPIAAAAAAPSTPAPMAAAAASPAVVPTPLQHHMSHQQLNFGRKRNPHMNTLTPAGSVAGGPAAAAQATPQQPAAAVHAAAVAGGPAQKRAAKEQCIRTEDRSILGAAGQMAGLGSEGKIESLPADTIQHFPRDPTTNQLLWYPGPPIDPPEPIKPHHSLAYLHHLVAPSSTTFAADAPRPAKRQRRDATAAEAVADPLEAALEQYCAEQGVTRADALNSFVQLALGEQGAQAQAQALQSTGGGVGQELDVDREVFEGIKSLSRELKALTRAMERRVEAAEGAGPGGA